ncbi:hypothetical protein RUM43_014516 [Polyplax serrata]|uniref:Moesin/ezrin/radixin homolog 1 n=1 Tax=Polyplax serrata TaxID=468196 RepID=A0AAN8P3W0_POLSC
MLKLGSKTDINASYKCTVRLLDDTEVLECEFQPHHKGTYLLEHVCNQLSVIEKDYFGLRYVDVTKQRHWLDLEKAVMKQIKDVDPLLFSFRVKFYPPNPVLLKEEITRYHIYLQLKRDLLHGRLYCTHSDAALLGSFIVQAELGDYDPEIHVGNYVSEFKLLLKQTQTIEEKILELHQTQLKGQSPTTMECHFLKKACQLDTYGVDPYPVKDHKGNPLYLGINHLGVLTFQGSKKAKHFTWSEIQKINYEGKMFIIHLVYYEDARTKKKHTVGYKCPTAAACRYVWRCAVEQMLFFTLQKSADAPILTGGGLFSWGTKFKYSGRTEKEILHESRYGKNPEGISSGQTGRLRRKSSSVPATPSTPVGSDLCGLSAREGNYTEDYDFRDSFDRSSCDSQLQDSITKTTLSPSLRSSRSQSPQHTCRLKKQTSKPSLPTTDFVQLTSAPLPGVVQPKASTIEENSSSIGKFNLFQVFVPSFLFVAISLFAATILILESDSDLLNNIRGLPEMITLKKHYYEPVKEFLTRRLLKIIFRKEH